MEFSLRVGYWYSGISSEPNKMRKFPDKNQKMVIEMLKYMQKKLSYIAKEVLVSIITGQCHLPLAIK